MTLWQPLYCILFAIINAYVLVCTEQSYPFVDKPGEAVQCALVVSTKKENWITKLVFILCEFNCTEHLHFFLPNLFLACISPKIDRLYWMSFNTGTAAGSLHQAHLEEID